MDVLHIMAIKEPEYKNMDFCDTQLGMNKAMGTRWHEIY